MSDTILYCTKMDSPVGPLALVSSQKGLLRVLFLSSHRNRNFTTAVQKNFPNAEIIESETKFQEVMTQLREYFEGKRRTFSVELDLRGTLFQLQVWHALQKVRYGETATYGEIARKIQKPNASRAVGNACRANPIPILIPCHRVIGKNGDLTGFAGGLETKRQLLHLESQFLSRSDPFQCVASSNRTWGN